MHTNSYENVVVSGIFSESVSHHSPIFQISDVAYVTDNAKIKNQHVQYDFSRSNIECFIKKLSEVTSNFSTAENDFKTFVDIFTSSMNTACKISKPKITKRNNINNPWITDTDSLIHSIETKHKLYKNWKRSIISGHPEGSIEMLEKYRNYNKSLKN